MQPAATKQKTYERMYHTLLDTICDPLIETHWRYICLDNINRLLINIQKRAKITVNARKSFNFIKN